MTSDFHWAEPPEVPACDLLILAGDVLPANLGSGPRPGGDFADWLDRQPATHKVGIAGNHDWAADADEAAVRRLPWTYLRNETADVGGRRVFGSPFSMPFNNLAFMVPEHDLAAIWATIPEDVQILIVHGPAHGILDRTTRGANVGSVTLRDRLRELPDLELFVTGHIHEQYGQTEVVIPGHDGNPRSVRCVNGSWIDQHNRSGNKPIEIEL